MLVHSLVCHLNEANKEVENVRFLWTQMCSVLSLVLILSRPAMMTINFK